MNSKIILLILILSAGGAAVVAAQGSARPKAGQLSLVSEVRDTRVYVLEYEDHTCFVASSINSAGVSINCPH